MERVDIFNNLLSLIEKCDFGGMKIAKELITEESDFIKNIGFDSLDKVELMMEVEYKYLIKIDEQEENEICTVKDLIDIIIKKKTP